MCKDRQRLKKSSSRGAHARHAPGLPVLALICAAGIAGATPARALEAIECDTGVPASTMRLFDAHDHFRVPNAAEGEAELALLAGHGVSLGAIALGTPEPNEFSVALELQSSSATPVFAFATPRPVTGAGGESTYDGTTLADLQTQFGAGASGIGEMLLRHSGPLALAADIPADQATAMAIYAEAAARGVPVWFHFETRDKSAPTVDISSRIEELEAAVGDNPNTTFIWSHLGDTEAGTVRTLIEAYDNLYADLSTRNPHFVRGWPVALQSLSEGLPGDVSLKPEWSELFGDHPTRFLLGFDLANPDRWAVLSQVVSYYRGVLGELSQQTAERIACKNAQALLSTNSLPGPSFPWTGIGGLGILALGLAAAERTRLGKKDRRTKRVLGPGSEFR